jgi:hypothetical protein
MAHLMIEWLTLIFAAIAAIGSVVRVVQDEHLWKLHLKAHKKKRKKNSFSDVAKTHARRPHSRAPLGASL